MVLPSARAGGAERVFVNLLQRLSRDIFELHLILIESSGAYLDMLPPDVQIHVLGYNRVGRALVKLAVVLRRLKPHVVMSSIGHLNLALLSIRPFLHKKTKVIVRESNMPSMSFATGAKFAFFRLLYPLLYSRADRIICPGIAIKNELENIFRISKEKMQTIPNPVLLENVRSQTAHHLNPFNQDGIHLVAAGSLTRQKGFDLLIIAMEKLAEIRPGLHLTIIGEGPERDELRHRICASKLEDSITLAGFQENPYAFFYHADLFVLSSRWEGLPNVVLESLACGTPVVAFDCPGSVREIFDDRSQGILVPAEDVEALAGAIDQFLAKRNGSHENTLLPERFDVKSVLAKYQDILIECCR
ncbi:MAG: glycosyltransferase [Thermodesulfobacteriota bacterium]|jgi:glycosyltransferase involved in cell wall biosynthesis|nr:glycosyltransferase [Thermodesulfobacteriota bacterium]